jgi:hypothetical protein
MERLSGEKEIIACMKGWAVNIRVGPVNAPIARKQTSALDDLLLGTGLTNHVAEVWLGAIW